VFDAFAAGVPVVQTTDGWISNLLEREECGITVPARNPLAMGDAIIQLAHDDAMRSRLATNARRVAQTKFDRTTLAEKMRRICVEAASRNGSREGQRNVMSIPAPQRTGDQ
jgi:glycosyltransferase involved in cell wall biosynthesis